MGNVTALYLIVLINDSKNLNDPRKLACYAGIAPFPYASETSVKRKEKVYHFANKELKTLLHLCAVSLLKMNNTFSDFIERKKKQGNPIMSILNGLRSKILICACVRKIKNMYECTCINHECFSLSRIKRTVYQGKVRKLR